MIKSYGERILVRIVEVPKEKKGLLIMPEDKKDFQIAQVVDTLADDYLFIGDYVYTRKYSGLLIEYDGVEYVSLDRKEILAYSKELK